MTTAVAPPPPAPPASAPASATPAAAPASPPADQKPPEGQPPAAEPEKPKNTILGGEQPKGEPKPGEGAPEKYADFALPEGIESNAKLMESFKATAKALNLSQENAQKLVDFQAQNVKEEIESRLTAFNSQIAEWEKQSRAAFGGEWEKQFGIASKAVERFGSPALRELLNESGMGNHPELVRFFAKVGAALSEDDPDNGRSAGGERVPTEKLMFPTMEKKK